MRVERQRQADAEYLRLGFDRSEAGWKKEIDGETFEFKVLDWRDLDDLEKVVDLQDRVWKMGDRNLVPPNILAVIEETGGKLLLANAEDGSARGFVLTLATSKPDRLFLHMVGVDPEYHSRGLARNLMIVQGIEAREKQINEILWTYDPLMGANAKLYLAGLGAVPFKYTINKYGLVKNDKEGTESRYKNVETDRFTVRWDVGNNALWNLVTSGGGGLTELDIDFEWDGVGNPPDMFRVSMPYDFTKLSTDEMMDWRRHLRNAATRVMTVDNIDSMDETKGSHEVIGMGSSHEQNVNYYVFAKKGLR